MLFGSLHPHLIKYSLCNKTANYTYENKIHRFTNKQSKISQIHQLKPENMKNKTFLTKPQNLGFSYLEMRNP